MTGAPVTDCGHDGDHPDDSFWAAVFTAIPVAVVIIMIIMYVVVPLFQLLHGS